MSYKRRTPKKEECIMPMQIVHFHNYEKTSKETKVMIDKMIKKANELIK